MGNPKDDAARAEDRAPLDYLEPAADEAVARVMKLGADKYGRRNYTVADVGLSTYIAAMRRHLNAIVRGEWIDAESGQPHLAHIGANVHVLLGADEAGKLTHDIIAEAKVVGLDPRESREREVAQHAAEIHDDEFIPRGADAALPPEMREKTTEFDFGFGLVPAHRHINPDEGIGGWVAETATVEQTAWVYGKAQVYGEARVSGEAWVSGNAWVGGEALVSGKAQVYGKAKVYGKAWVGGKAQVYGKAKVYGKAQVYGEAWLSGEETRA